MQISNNRARVLSAGVSLLAVLVAMPALGQEAAPQDGDTLMSELVVTAQRREEALQDVPIAVSAFSQTMLEAQKIDGGANLQRAVPNVTFSKGFYSGYNFQIRGIGTKQTAVTGDTSTGVHLNGAPLTENRLFEAEFFDVERVEVLRGPQGTLYGRNATGGVVNVITAKPTNSFEAAIRGEIGNFDTRKVRAMVNIPLIDDTLALRVAGSYLSRSGFATNLTTGHDIDGRDLYSVRASLAFTPVETFKANLVWQHFEEDDDRLRTGKGLCTRDNGPSSVGGVAVTNNVVRGFLSQGCTNGSIYADAANGTPNSLSTLFGLLAYRGGLASGDLSANRRQVADLSTVESAVDPSYYAKEDVLELSAAWDITPTLQFNLLTSYYKGEYNSEQDMYRFGFPTAFNATATAPGGVVNDPQLGPANTLQVYDSNQHPSEQWTQEVRLSSSFEGPLNFSIGANYVDYETIQSFYILSNALTNFARVANGGATCALGATNCIYINPNPEPNPSGHGNYLSYQPYTLDSKAAFGEIYWEATDALKVTGGLRYTKDTKTLYSYPVKLLTPGSGLTPGAPASYTAEFSEMTGRVGVDWKPDLSFTDSTLLYAFYSRGYKGGGPNNIGAGGIGAPRPIYDPEFVNAYEVGMKNTLLDGTLILNLTGFYYDYKGYQISKFVNRISVTENIDAIVTGFEVEGIWEPVNNLRFNVNAGFLNTEVQNGSSIDPVNRTQGNPSLTLVKASSMAGCVAPTAALGNLLAIIQQQPGAATVAGVSGNPLALLGVCSGTFASLGVVPAEGVAAKLSGKELPNAPPWTVSLGAQYTWNLPSGWDATLRADYYRQGESFSRVYNTTVDRLEGWENGNISIQAKNEAMGLEIEAYVKNVFNDRPITDTFFVDEAMGLLQNAFILDPRTYGVSISKRF
ncbi:TonB-dependent receptor [Phenylobacterium sp.]|uniref:TonB-dependent receptor n=1 Tax=Phenylobacterium sp. TaxID=1871053 RepID=UPI002732DC69|nr:TonB-dependent receptor [Phenylobacterium sp.]MDP3852464.1 TonB-dependent receptor [Phenylobacterium sp.]